MSEQVTADTPMTVGMFHEYMAQRDEMRVLAMHRAMKAVEESRTRIPSPKIQANSVS
jgi:hypothetical protein